MRRSTRGVLAAATFATLAAAQGAPAQSGGQTAVQTFTPAHSVSRCTANACVIKLTTDNGVSTVTVRPLQQANGTASPSNPRRGMLNQDMRSDNPLRCGTYRGADQEAFEFFLGATGGLENVFYRIADTVKNADVKTTEFCLGARFSFTTLSRKLASKVQLPNGLDGFAGLVPRCTQQELSQPASSPPCSRKSTRRDSTSSTGYDVVFTVIVPAIGGDPWGRA